MPGVPRGSECLKWLECPRALSARMLKCLQTVYRVPKWNKVLYFVCSNIKICQKCCVIRIIFVPKLLDKNRSQIDKTYIFKQQKRYPSGGVSRKIIL